MNKIRRERTPFYISDTKQCARQMVKESLPKILAATFQTPSLEKMISILTRDFDHSFDEFMARRGIMKSHPEWGDDQIEAEKEMHKRGFENELGVNLRLAAINTVAEIEKLLSGLNKTIKNWKIENLWRAI